MSSREAAQTIDNLIRYTGMKNKDTISAMGLLDIIVKANDYLQVINCFELKIRQTFNRRRILLGLATMEEANEFNDWKGICSEDLFDDDMMVKYQDKKLDWKMLSRRGWFSHTKFRLSFKFTKEYCSDDRKEENRLNKKFVNDRNAFVEYALREHFTFKYILMFKDKDLDWSYLTKLDGFYDEIGCKHCGVNCRGCNIPTPNGSYVKCKGCDCCLARNKNHDHLTDICCNICCNDVSGINPLEILSDKLPKRKERKSFSGVLKKCKTRFSCGSPPPPIEKPEPIPEPEKIYEDLGDFCDWDDFTEVYEDDYSEPDVVYSVPEELVDEPLTVIAPPPEFRDEPMYHTLEEPRKKERRPAPPPPQPKKPEVEDLYAKLDKTDIYDTPESDSSSTWSSIDLEDNTSVNPYQPTVRPITPPTAFKFQPFFKTLTA